MDQDINRVRKLAFAGKTLRAGNGIMHFIDDTLVDRQPSDVPLTDLQEIVMNTSKKNVAFRAFVATVAIAAGLGSAALLGIAVVTPAYAADVSKLPEPAKTVVNKVDQWTTVKTPMGDGRVYPAPQLTNGQVTGGTINFSISSDKVERYIEKKSNR